MTRNILFIFILFTLHPSINSQASWFEKNATWHYEFNSYWEGVGYEKMSYLGDSLIDGRLCKKISRDIYFINRQTLDTSQIKRESKFLYEEDNTIWEYKNNIFFKLYNFDLEPGDTVAFMKFPSLKNNVCIVDSIEFINLNGIPLKKQLVAVYEDSKIFTKITIVEKLGVVTAPFSFFWNEFVPGLMDGRHWKFRCYADSLFQEVNFTNDDCEGLPFLLTINDNIAYEYIHIYPNPFKEEFLIETKEKKIDKIRIFDLYGNVIFENDGNIHYIKFDQVNSGVYIIVLNFGNASIKQTLIKIDN
jgi:hypothetical protein